MRVLVDEGSARVHELIALGAVFDRLPGGDLSRAREGGHSTARVLHAGGAATGAEVERALVQAVREARPPSTRAGSRSTSPSTRRPAGAAVSGRSTPPVGVATSSARHVVLAAGGAGQVFAVTTNPTEATGDGIAMALRAGVPVADMEFMQFHPTALHHPVMPRPLVSEALRGHGAVLRDAEGNRFVDELQPARRGQPCDRHPPRRGGLDARLAGRDRPRGLRPAGSRPSRAPSTRSASTRVATGCRSPRPPTTSPVACSSTWTGPTALPGLWAAGEVACAGVHGANRLASNSLLEGMVFGARCVDAILSGRDGPRSTGALAGYLPTDGAPHPAPIPIRLLPACRCGPGGGHGPIDAHEAPAGAGDPATRLVESEAALQRSMLQGAMTADAGVVRDRASLERAAVEVDRLAGRLHGPVDREAAELRNLVDVARSMLEAASVRTETARLAHEGRLPRAVGRAALPARPRAGRPAGRGRHLGVTGSGACCEPTSIPPQLPSARPSPPRSRRTPSPSAT